MGLRKSLSYPPEPVDEFIFLYGIHWAAVPDEEDGHFIRRAQVIHHLTKVAGFHLPKIRN
jgi:hypothetical protein